MTYVYCELSNIPILICSKIVSHEQAQPSQIQMTLVFTFFS